MANWCKNSLEVIGNDSKTEDFVKKFMENGISAFIPTPKELEDVASPVEILSPEIAEKNIEKYGATDWCDWRIENWGTKWDVGELTLSGREEEYALFTFDTAWSPIVAAIEKIAGDYPELMFTLDYEESGNGFFGRAVFRDGHKETQFDYNWEDRFREGWWLYKEIEDVYEQTDLKLNDMLSDKDITEEDYKKLSELFETLGEAELTRLLAIIDKEDAKAVKIFLKEDEIIERQD